MAVCGERDVERGDRGGVLERAPEDLLDTTEPVAKGVVVQAHGLGGPHDVEVVREVRDERVEQPLVGAELSDQLVDLGLEALASTRPWRSASRGRDPRRRAAAGRGRSAALEHDLGVAQGVRDGGDAGGRASHAGGGVRVGGQRLGDGGADVLRRRLDEQDAGILAGARQEGQRALIERRLDRLAQLPRSSRTTRAGVEPSIPSAAARAASDPWSGSWPSSRASRIAARIACSCAWVMASRRASAASIGAVALAAARVTCAIGCERRLDTASQEPPFMSRRNGVAIVSQPSCSNCISAAGRHVISCQIASAGARPVVPGPARPGRTG